MKAAVFIKTIDQIRQKNPLGIIETIRIVFKKMPIWNLNWEKKETQNFRSECHFSFLLVAQTFFWLEIISWAGATSIAANKFWCFRFLVLFFLHLEPRIRSEHIPLVKHFSSRHAAQERRLNRSIRHLPLNSHFKMSWNINRYQQWIKVDRNWSEWDKPSFFHRYVWKTFYTIDKQSSQSKSKVLGLRKSCKESELRALVSQTFFK